MTEPVWEQTVDGGKYRCWVDRIDGYNGMLNVERDGVSLLQEVVSLSYQAIFGPDVGDVGQWQDRCIKAIDADYKARGEEVPE